MINFFKKNKNVETQNGLNKIYSKNGKGTLVSEFTVVDGVIEGELRKYYDDGSIHVIENYKSGKLHGKRTTYFSYGVIDSMKNYSYGKLHGEQKSYDLKGNVTHTTSYVNGVSQEDIVLKKNLLKVFDFVMKIRKTESKIKFGFSEIIKLSNQELKIKCNEFSKSSELSENEIFKYAAYKRLFGIVYLLREPSEENLNETMEFLFKKIDKEFHENTLFMTSDITQKLNFFDDYGVYKDTSKQVKVSYTPRAGWIYWDKKYSSTISDIYRKSKYNLKVYYGDIDEYLKILQNSESDLFYLSSNQYAELMMLFHNSNKIFIKYDEEKIDNKNQEIINNQLIQIIKGDMSRVDNDIESINEIKDDKSKRLLLSQIKDGLFKDKFELIINVEFENNGYFQFLKPDEELAKKILENEAPLLSDLVEDFSESPDFRSDIKVFGENNWFSIGTAKIKKEDAIEMINELIDHYGDCRLEELNDDFTEWYSDANSIYEAKKFFKEFKFDMISSKNYFEDSSNSINEEISWCYSTMMTSQFYNLSVV